MKLFDIAAKIKTELGADIVAVQSGFYFNVYDDDAEYLQEIFGLSIYTQSDKFLTGFPVSALEKYNSEFKNRGLKYAFVEQERENNDQNMIVRKITRTNLENTHKYVFVGGQRRTPSKFGKQRYFLDAILDGYHPLTGEIFEEDCIWRSPEIIDSIREFLRGEPSKVSTDESERESNDFYF